MPLVSLQRGNQYYKFYFHTVVILLLAHFSLILNVHIIISLDKIAVCEDHEIERVDLNTCHNG